MISLREDWSTLDRILSMMRTVRVVKSLQCVGLRCCCVVLQSAWQENESKSGQNTRGSLHAKPSRKVNAVSTNTPMDNLPSLCNDVCPSD
jgi:hypothetical protein